MKLSNFLNAYEEYSGKASDVSRQLAFAGIALIWIFRYDVSDSSDGYVLPNALLIPLTLLIAALSADLFQYVIASLIWYVFHRHHEKLRTNDSDPELEAPYYLHYPISLFFIIKIIFVIISYVLFLRFAISSIFFI